MNEPKHIKFEELVFEKPRKTRAWSVISKHDDSYLGRVQWFGRWRKFAFFPEAVTTFEEQCLRDIANFVVAMTKEHRAKNSAQRAEASLGN
jgi:hypothetical protein